MDEFDRDKVEDIVSRKNEEFERYITLQMTSINAKLDDISNKMSTIHNRQNDFDISLLKIEMANETSNTNKESTCPYKKKIEVLVNEQLTKQKINNLMYKAIGLSVGLTAILIKVFEKL